MDDSIPSLSPLSQETAGPESTIPMPLSGAGGMGSVIVVHPAPKTERSERIETTVQSGWLRVNVGLPAACAQGWKYWR
jgi:hypothetical protein